MTRYTEAVRQELERRLNTLDEVIDNTYHFDFEADYRDAWVRRERAEFRAKLTREAKNIQALYDRKFPTYGPPAPAKVVIPDNAPF